MPQFVTRRRPFINFHGVFLHEIFVHVKCVPQQMWLMTHSFLKAVILGDIKIFLQDGLVVGMCAFTNDLARSFPRRKTTNICESL